jgi:hypothetical protein
LTHSNHQLKVIKLLVNQRIKNKKNKHYQHHLGLIINLDLLGLARKLKVFLMLLLIILSKGIVLIFQKVDKLLMTVNKSHHNYKDHLCFN